MKVRLDKPTVTAERGVDEGRWESQQICIRTLISSLGQMGRKHAGQILLEKVNEFLHEWNESTNAKRI